MTEDPQSLAALPRGFVDSARLFLRPLALTSGPAARALVQSGAALWLAGGTTAFSALEVIARARPGLTRRAAVALPSLRAWATVEGPPVASSVARYLDHLSRPRPPLAGLTMDTPRVMGVVNVTPDSFYNGSRHPDSHGAIALGRKLRADGADIIDVGGESTRPGADPVPQAEERARIIPVVRTLAAEGALVSIDTRRAAIMLDAVAAGAQIINDVAALSGEGSLQAAAKLGVPVVLMHASGDPDRAVDPRTMQNAPRYDDVVLDVYEYLEARIATCEAAGIPRERLIVDPGIGFAKTPAHNAAVLESLATFQGLGCRVLLGASRKSFIAKFSAGEPPDFRLAGSLAAAQWAASQGVQILRVHDVAETRQALAIAAKAANPRLLPAAV